MDHGQRTFIDRMGQAAESDGLSPIAGRLFALLLLSDEPRSLDEIAATLGVSKASVSTDARRLLERGIVERSSPAGDRRDYYELTPDFFAQIIRSRVARWRNLHGLVGGMRDAGTTVSAVVRGRVASIDDIHSFVVDRIDAALTDWERGVRKPAPKPAPKPTVRRRRGA